MEAVVVTAAGMVGAEGAGVRGHPGGTGNVVAAIDHDHGAEIDQVEVGDVPDPGNICYYFLARVLAKALNLLFYIFFSW